MLLCLVQSEDRDIGLNPLMPSRPVQRGWMVGVGGGGGGGEIREVQMHPFWE